MIIKKKDEYIDGVGPWWWIWNEEKNSFETGSWFGPSREFGQLRDRIWPYIRKTDVVLTAGGCQGMYPRLWGKDFKKVIAVEPCPDNFQVMQKNCVGDKFVLIEAALGEKNGKGILYRYKTRENVGMHSMAEMRKSDNQVTVKMITIDSLGLEDLDLLQLDVESYEVEVLRGAEETVAKFRPVIVVENGDAHKSEPFADFFGRHKYKFETRVVSDIVYVPHQGISVRRVSSGTKN